MPTLSEKPPAEGALSAAMAIVILAALAVVIAGVIRWAAVGRLALAPTPTATATAQAQPTATPDFRATQVAEDLAAQQTYSAEINYATPAIQLTLAAQEVYVPIVAQAPGAMPVPLGDTPTPTAAEVLLPIVSGQESAPATPQSPVATPTSLPGQAESQLPADETPAAAATATPSFTPTPTATPTPQTSPTPRFVAATMRASIVTSAESPAIGYAGPSSIYTATVSFSGARTLDLTGRTASGEWVYGCCDDDGKAFWIRQAHARPTDNDFVPALPTEEPQNDVRWLPTRLPPAGLTPFPTPTTIPPFDYPLLRRDPGNRAQVADLPRPPLGLLWNPDVSTNSLQSPLVVAGNSIVAANGDDHVYFLSREGGNQRHRVLIGADSSFAGALADDAAYFIDNSGRLLKLQINSPNIVLDSQIGPPSPSGGGLNLVAEYVLYPANGANGDDRLFLIKREDFAPAGDRITQGGNLRYPAVGDQLVYAGDRFVEAFDPFDGLAFIWRADTGAAIAAPPLYAAPGVQAAAELYVADETGRVVSLDANTGAQIWNVQLGSQRVISMAVDDDLLYVAGNAFIRALRRTNGEDAWPNSIGLSDQPLTGPIVGATEILVMTADGGLRYLNKQDGNTAATYNNSATRLSAAGAVSGPWIYQAGVDAKIYGWRGGE